MSHRSIIFCGSKVLFLRGLLKRKPHDLDILLIPMSRKYANFIKSIVPNADVLFNKYNFENYEYLWYKNRYIKVLPTFEILFAKYQIHKHYLSGYFKNKSVKHTNDLINVFHNLGQEKSLEEIHKMSISLEDRVELIRLMKIGINNKEEI